MIAVSQIMAYHKKPYSNYITAAMWPGMINNVTTSVELQRLMLDLFNAMQTSFDKEGTSSNISKARGFLNNNGYTAGSESGYSFDKVWNALNYGTYVQGTNPLINKGHAWVADGARQTKITTYDVYTTIYKGKVYEIQGSAYMSTSLEVRYDWGWKHGNNTWFASGVFAQDPNSLNYNKDVKIISYIY